jgi:hypothetical protein
VTCIKKLQTSGFPPTGGTLCKLAFQFPERDEIPRRFSRDKCMAGWDWLLILRRYPGLIRNKTQGLSLHRAMAMNREGIEDYFNLALDMLTENNLLDIPGHIYNMDKFEFQMNPRPDTVRKALTLYQMTPGEKGETMSVIAI